MTQTEDMVQARKDGEVGPLEQFWLNARWLDLLIPLAVVILHGIALKVWGDPKVILEIPAAKRVSLYSSSAMVISLTGTLGSLSVGQYLSGRGDRVMALKRALGPAVGNVWRTTFLGSAGAAVMVLIAIGLDSVKSPGIWGPLLFEFAALVGLLTFLRLVLLFSRVIGLVVQDDVDPITVELQDFDDSRFS